MEVSNEEYLTNRARAYLAQGYFGGKAYTKSVPHKGICVAGVNYWQPLEERLAISKSRDN